MCKSGAAFLVIADVVDAGSVLGPQLVISLETRRVVCRCIDELCASTICSALNDLAKERPAVIALLEGKVV